MRKLSTPNVYSTFDKMGAGDGDDNHLQRAAVVLHPRSGEAIEAALAAGASRSFVSGSGPSVIAFVPDDAVARRVRTAWGAIRHGGSHHRCAGAGETGHNRPAIPVLSRQTVTLICVPVS